MQYILTQEELDGLKKSSIDRDLCKRFTDEVVSVWQKRMTHAAHKFDTSPFTSGTTLEGFLSEANELYPLPNFDTFK